jgi:uncharacterized protein YndB with AHSA1/START domain
MTFLLAQTLFLFSLDGLGHQIFTQAPYASQLKTLRRMAANGAMADGLQAAFPSTTANSHAALWTGVYGDRSQITANSQPLLPRSAHTFLERGSGYRADQLAAEPIWVIAGRQNRRSVVYQAPQAFPFLPINTHPNAVTLNGYQTRQIAGHRVLRRADLTFDSSDRFHFEHGPVTLRGRLLPGGLAIEGVPVRYKPAVTRYSGARHFSSGYYVDAPVPAVIYFRLFEYTSSDLLLYVSPIQELAISQGDARDLLRSTGGFIGNSYAGPALNVWQALETSELVARQNARHTLWLARRHKPDLFVGYLPLADELGHRFIGLYRNSDPEALRAMDWGYRIIEEWSRQVTALAGARDHVIVTADHGMTPVTKLVNIRGALRRAGLDASVSSVSNFVVLNTPDWKNGAVQDREGTLSRVRAVLTALRNPEPVIAGFFTPEEHGGKFGIGGPAGGDLYFDLEPGYYVRDGIGELFPPLDKPIGAHGHRPDREDMLATLIVRGPTIPKATRWPRMRSIEVAPLAAKLLGIRWP